MMPWPEPLVPANSTTTTPDLAISSEEGMNKPMQRRSGQSRSLLDMQSMASLPPKSPAFQKSTSWLDLSTIFERKEPNVPSLPVAPLVASKTPSSPPYDWSAPGGSTPAALELGATAPAGSPTAPRRSRSLLDMQSLQGMPRSSSWLDMFSGKGPDSP